MRDLDVRVAEKGAAFSVFWSTYSHSLNPRQRCNQRLEGSPSNQGPRTDLNCLQGATLNEKIDGGPPQAKGRLGFLDRKEEGEGHEFIRHAPEMSLNAPLGQPKGVKKGQKWPVITSLLLI